MWNLNTNTAILPTRHLEAVRNIQPYGIAATPEKVCVIQDLGTGVLKIRFYPVPGFGTAWGVNLVYQKKAPLLTSLSSTWSPVPDEISYVLRQGFLAAGYRYLNSPKAPLEDQKYILAVQRALGADERETADVRLYPGEGWMTSPDSWWPSGV
jgi:hypothetical protein